MQAYLWSRFVKDDNSTARPLFADGVDVQISLIEPTDVVHPGITYKSNQPPVGFNYAFITEFQRYYFIDSWSYYGGLWRADLVCDFLATWKTQIGNSTQYVLRASGEFEGTIIDSLIPMKTRPYVTEISATGRGGVTQYSPIDADIANGTYVCGIINNDTSGVGVTTYYAFSAQGFRSFCNYLMGGQLITDMGIAATEVSEALTKALFNPIQYVASCRFFPIAYNKISGTAVTSLKYGYWTANNINAKRLTSLRYYDEFYFTGIPHHPDSGRGYYVRTEPYTSVSLFWTTFGRFDLPAEMLYDSDTISCFMTCDMVTGNTKLVFNNKLPTGTAPPRTQQQIIEVTVGASVQLSQITQEIPTNASTAIMSAVKGVVGAVIGADKGITSAVNSIAPKLTTISSNGDFSSYAYIPSIQISFHYLAEEDVNRLGKPLCAPRVISTLGKTSAHSGYILCSNVEIELPGYAQDMREVKTKMESGFFYA